MRKQEHFLSKFLFMAKFEYTVIIDKKSVLIFVFIDISPEGRATVGSSAIPWQPVGQVKQASDHVPVVKN